MAINWNRPSTRFSFGQLAPHETQLYEDNPSLAWQKVLDWYGQGNPNFAMTTLGRFIASKQDETVNRLTAEQAAQVARNTQGRINWQTQEDQRRSAWDAQQQQARSAFDTQRTQDMTNLDTAIANIQGLLRNPLNFPGGEESARRLQYQQTLQGLMQQRLDAERRTFTPGTYQAGAAFAPEEGLTLTKYLEGQDLGQYANQFGQLTSNQRGANPGLFRVRREIW